MKYVLPEEKLKTEKPLHIRVARNILGNPEVQITTKDFGPWYTLLRFHEDGTVQVDEFKHGLSHGLKLLQFQK